MGGQCPNPPRPTMCLLPTVTARAAAYALFWLFFWVDSVFSIFYLGKTTAGIIALIGTWVLCGIPSILWLIQGILMFVMSPEDFERKYEATHLYFPVVLNQ